MISLSVLTRLCEEHSILKCQKTCCIARRHLTHFDFARVKYNFAHPYSFCSHSAVNGDQYNELMDKRQLIQNNKIGHFDMTWQHKILFTLFSLIALNLDILHSLLNLFSHIQLVTLFIFVKSNNVKLTFMVEIWPKNKIYKSLF